MAQNNLDLRRALEALRNGVPNRDAVRVLGCEQTTIVERFKHQLNEVQTALGEDRQATGMLIEGGFGTGKSHLLEYLKHLALERNFVCSLIVVSKETPLYDPAKVYLAAVENAEVPKVTGHAIQEIALKLRPDSHQYAELYRWANSNDSGLAAIFPATLLLHERLQGDPEMIDSIHRFWAGQGLSIPGVRRKMRETGHAATYQIRPVPAKELPSQRFRFAARLMRAAGYGGWVLLIDELELIGRYSRLQRARSYSELARWLGRVEAAQCPALTSVGAITDDFAQAILRDKGDLDYVRPQLEARIMPPEYDALVSRAETGMHIIEREAVHLERPGRGELDHTYRALKRIHAEAYDWTPPELASANPSVTTPVRSYVRRWIGEWDLRRIYPGEAVETVETPVHVDYTGIPDLEERAPVTEE